MEPAEYYAMHKKAFRAAFDYLNNHFPPEPEDGWWIKLSQDASDACLQEGENRLVINLIGAIMDYIEYEHKRRNQSG